MNAAPLLVLAVALLPAGFVWWTGRRLLRQIDDSALPELMFARRQRLVSVLAVSLVLLVAVGRRHALWGLPVLYVASLIAHSPLRRRLRNETGGLRDYLWFSLRSIAGGFGFWILLLVAPTLVNAVGAWWPALLALLLVLLAWEHWYVPVWLRLHGAVPLVDAELEPRIAEILRRANTVVPRIYKVGGDARIVNAVALPALRQPAVAFGNGLLELLDPDESAAIFAHELAHSEHHAPRVMRRHQLANRALILLGVGVPFGALVAGATAASTWIALVWPVVALLALLRRVARRQTEETEADLRAAALTGDPEVVIRALIKVHVHAFIPRRWPIDFERSASHPSLTRRIQTLRGTSESTAAPALAAPVIVPTARAGSLVAFDDGRAHWFDGLPDDAPRDVESLRARASAYRAVRYDDLTELRVTAAGGARALRATHRNQETWSVPLEPAQVALVQHALDIVDVRLHRELGRRPHQGGLFVTIALLTATMIAGEIGVLLVPIMLMLFRPSPAAGAALGAMAVVGAALSWLDAEQSALLPHGEWALLALAVLGVVGVWLAVRDARRDGARDGTRLTAGVLGVLSVLVLAWLVSTQAFSSLAALGDQPGLRTLAVALAGVGAVLLLTRRGRQRLAGAALAVVALACTAFALVASPRLERRPALEERLARATLIAEMRVDGGAQATGLRLSSDGRHVLLHEYNPALRRARRIGQRLIVSGVDGKWHELDAFEAVFVAGGRMLSLRTLGDSLELRLGTPMGDSTAMVDTLPPLENPVLNASPLDSTWTIAGTDPQGDDLVVWSGVLGRHGRATRTIAGLDSLIETQMLVFGGGTRIVVPTFARPSTSSPGLFAALTMRSELWQRDSAGLHRLAVLSGFPECGMPAMGVAACIVRGRAGAQLWLVRESGTATEIARFPVSTRGGGGRAIVGAGGQVVLPPDDAHVQLLDARTARSTLVTLPAHGGGGFITDAAAVPGYLALTRYAGQTRVALYRLEDPPVAGAR